MFSISVKITHLFILGNDHPDVTRILSLEDLDNIRTQRLVPSIAYGSSILGLSLDHTPVEFIFVSECCLLAQFLQSILFRLVVSSSMDIVFMFFEVTEFLSVEELTSFFVVTFRERVCGCQTFSQRSISPYSGPTLERCVDHRD